MTTCWHCHWRVFFVSRANVIDNAERQHSSASYDTSELLLWHLNEYERTLFFTVKSWVKLRKSPCAAKCCD